MTYLTGRVARLELADLIAKPKYIVPPARRKSCSSDTLFDANAIPSICCSLVKADPSHKELRIIVLNRQTNTQVPEERLLDH